MLPEVSEKLIDLTTGWVGTAPYLNGLRQAKFDLDKVFELLPN